jgi:hypothetical protein
LEIINNYNLYLEVIYENLDILIHYIILVEAFKHLENEKCLEKERNMCKMFVYLNKLFS